MCESWQSFFDASNQRLRDQNRLRQRGSQRCNEAWIDFASNDYLGLSRHPKVIAAAQAAMDEVGWGSGASPVLNGYSRYHAELEESLKRHFCSEDALLFSSGYACNVGTLSSLAGDGVLVLSDQLNHASLIDGMRLARAERRIYRHLDWQELETMLRDERHRFTRAIIVTESVFSMDGDIADLRVLSDIADKFDCGLIVDEAHATGVYGASGAGCVEESGMLSADPTRLIYKLGTLSKSLGGIGGFATGSKGAISHLINAGRSYLFSTSPPAASAAAAKAALELVATMQAERTQLRASSTALRQRLADDGWQVPAGDSPIVPVIIGSEPEALRISRGLGERGLLVPAIRPPTVPPGTCRLRISLSSQHTGQQLDDLVRGLAESK